MSRKSRSPGPAPVSPAAPDMSRAPDLTTAPAPLGALVAPDDLEDDPPPPAFDAHGFDPSEYSWVPVRRQRRPDGWSNDRQRGFIEALADCGSVTEAARAVGMSITSCYRLRRAPGAEPFAAAWEAAIAQASKRLADIALERAINGVEEPVFDRDGQRIACRTRYNDRLLMFLLRAHQPERYRHAHQGARHPNELPAPSPAPVAAAIATLEPVTPPDPHLLMPPEDLADALMVADIGDGTLPHWYRDPPVDPDPVAALPPLRDPLRDAAGDLPRDPAPALSGETGAVAAAEPRSWPDLS
ncbi:hypothetical protein [Sphingomonas sp. C3-2]|uniref:hypothetical protein n=1 Tax=Sphingomonas sp. C3-2 TaxID=3062169 RepID=UPI00294AC260|nr:hypothetical protein [Sphingomonas sp. C3-2]WOK37989.1 hypothetical protein QYC26_07365 [Sphingomonas sp. C3-2]